jgi:hypothetical protein
VRPNHINMSVKTGASRSVKHQVHLCLLCAVSLAPSFLNHIPIGPANAQASDPVIAQVTADLTARFANGGRYMIGSETAAAPHEHCQTLGPDDEFFRSPLGQPYAGMATHPNARMLVCNYPTTTGPAADGGRGWVILLAAISENIATRLVSACKAVVPAKVTMCVEALIGKRDPNNGVVGGKPVWGSNNLQFPVTGFVDEGPDDCQQAGKSGLIGFRHGVTIYYGKGPDDPDSLGFCFTDRDFSLEDQKRIGLTHRTNRVRNVGRIAGLGRDKLPDLEKPSDFANVEPPGLEADAWQRVVRNNEMRAIRTGYDRLMILQAALVMKANAPAFVPE